MVAALGFYVSYPPDKCMVRIPVDKNSPKWRSTAISEILQIEYRIVCCIETYLIHIYHMSKCSKCSLNRYIEGFCMWNVHFHINGLSPNMAYVIIMSWPLMAIYISFIELSTIFCAVFISYLMVINSKKYEWKYPNTIWWIMPLLWVNYEKNSNKPLMLLNME